MRHWLTGVGLAGALMSAGPVLAQSDDPDRTRSAPADGSAGEFESAPLQAGSDRLLSTAEDRTGLTIQLPADGAAMWMDQRDLALLSGRNQVAFQDLPADLHPDSLDWSTDTLPELTRLRRVQPAQADAPHWRGEVFIEEGGSRRLRLSYATPGLSAAIHYRLRLDGATEAEAGELTRIVTVHNDRREPVPAADLTAVNARGEAVALGPIDGLEPGSALQHLADEPMAVEVTPTLIARAQGDQPIAAPDVATVARHWTIAGFDAPVDGASVRVFTNEQGGQTPLGRGRFQATAADGEATLTAGVSSAVRIERLQADYRNRGAEGTEIAWRLGLSNTTDRPQTVRLDERIDGAWTIVEGEDDWQRVPTGLQRTIELDGGERREVGYRIRLR